MATECGTCLYSYVGSAKIYMGKTAAGEPLHFLGNINDVNISADINELGLIDYTAPGGGKCATATRINEARLNLTFWNLCPSNLALLTGGNYSEVPVTVVAGEVHDVADCGLISLEQLYDQSIPPVVNSVPAGTVYVEGTDYELTETGIKPIDGGAILDGSQVAIDYTSILSTCVEALTDLTGEYRVVIEAYNEANGKRIKTEIYRFKPNPTDNLPFITDDFGSATISGEILSDSTKVGNAVSRYYKMTVQTGEPT